MVEVTRVDVHVVAVLHPAQAVVELNLQEAAKEIPESNFFFGVWEIPRVLLLLLFFKVLFGK